MRSSFFTLPFGTDDGRAVGRATVTSSDGFHRPDGWSFSRILRRILLEKSQWSWPKFGGAIPAGCSAEESELNGRFLVVVNKAGIRRKNYSRLKSAGIIVIIIG